MQAPTVDDGAAHDLDADDDAFHVDEDEDGGLHDAADDVVLIIIFLTLTPMCEPAIHSGGVQVTRLKCCKYERNSVRWGVVNAFCGVGVRRLWQC